MANLLVSLILLLPARGAIVLQKVSHDRRRFGEIEDVFGRTFEETFKADSDVLASLGNAKEEHAGVVVEAQAMGLALLDSLQPKSSKRLAKLREQLKGKHTFNVNAGLGMALAKCGGALDESALDGSCSLLRWSIVDGYGFGLGYFEKSRHVIEKKIPDGLHGYMLRAFDQGLGRSFWFLEEGNIERVASVVEKFPESRRADLWSGVGLASAYSRSKQQCDFIALKRASGNYAAHLAMGIAFAAYIRQLAGNITENVELATQATWNDQASDVACVVERCRQNLPSDADLPAYEIWRKRVLVFAE